MIASSQGRAWLVWSAATTVLAMAASGSAFGQRAEKPSWSPSRDDASIASLEPAGSSKVVRMAAAEEILSGEPQTVVPRPARLMPRGVGRMHTEYVDGPTVTEQLPAPASQRMVMPHPGSHGTVYHGASHGYAGQEMGCASCGGQGCGDCCEVDCCGNWRSCGPVSPCCLLPCVSLANFEVHAGVQGFTGPLNRGGTSSFGFYEGFNHAFSLCNTGFCGQFGAQWTQSNFNGAYFTEESRNQTFLTIGAFRRADCGLQGGLVFDYLHDEWDYQIDVSQLRGEIGWKFDPCNEFGFWFASGVNDDSTSLAQPDIDDGEIDLDTSTVTVTVNDLYAFYYRRQFACGGEGRLFAGWSGNSQGLIGGDARVPLNPCWSLEANFLMLTTSDEGTLESFGFLDETWNVSVGLVWTPFARPNNCCPNYCRPLLNVANNGSFTTRLPPPNPNPQ